MEEDVIEEQGTSILEREAKIRGDSQPEPNVRIVTKQEQAADVQTEEDDEDSDDDETEDTARPVDLGPSSPDPGTFQPGDYAFEVQVFDQNNSHPKVRKITSPEQWDELLESDPNLGSAAALLKAQRNATKMENNLERDKREFDAKKKTFDDEKAQIDARNAQIETYVAEIGYLQQKGDLPEVAKKYVDADWSDPEIAKQPGVKEQLALLTYMRRENQVRIKAKLKPMTSILDAFNSYQIDRARKGQATTKVTAAQARRANGARVAAVSAPPVGQAPPGIAVGRGGSLRDLGRQAY